MVSDRTYIYEEFIHGDLLFLTVTLLCDSLVKLIKKRFQVSVERTQNQIKLGKVNFSSIIQ